MAIAPLVASAQTDTSTSRGGGTLSLYFENDLFAGTDRYYTNGVKAGWSTTDLENTAKLLAAVCARLKKGQDFTP